MKHFLSVFMVIAIAGIAHDIQRMWLANSLAHTDEGGVTDGRAIRAIFTVASAAPKHRSQRKSKMIFQILVDINDPKKKRRRKQPHKGEPYSIIIRFTCSVQLF